MALWADDAIGTILGGEQGWEGMGGELRFFVELLIDMVNGERMLDEYGDIVSECGEWWINMVG